MAADPKKVEPEVGIAAVVVVEVASSIVVAVVSAEPAAGTVADADPST